MLKEAYTTKMVETRIVFARKLFCDKCKKEIEPGLYFHVISGHNDWYEDSGDSIECRDYCSYLCLEEALNDFYFKEEKHSATAYFEIKRDEFIGVENGKTIKK